MEPGKEYDLSLGQSFFGQSADYCTMRYRDDFKPSQACRSGSGNLRISGNQVSLELPNAKAFHSAVQFEGVLERGKGGLDYVLLCDDDGFRLEALAGHVHDVRHMRNSNGPAVNGKTAAVSQPQIVRKLLETGTEAEHEQGVGAAAEADNVGALSHQTGQSAAEQTCDSTPDQHAIAPLRLSDSQSASGQDDDVAACQTVSQPDGTVSYDASPDTWAPQSADGGETHGGTHQQPNTDAAHGSHRSSSGQIAVRQGADSEHHPSDGGADDSKSGSSSSSGSDSDSERNDDSCDDSCDDQLPSPKAQEHSSEAAAAVQEVQLSEEERQFLGLSDAPDGLTEFI